MSRIGKKPIPLGTNLKAEIKGGVVTVTGPKGNLSFTHHPKVHVAIENNEIVVSVPNPGVKEQKALWGMTRAIIANLAAGVTSGFEKKLEVNGVGFKVALTGKTLTFALGFSHPIVMEVPASLTCTVEKNLITISGSDKQAVGQFAALIRDLKKPEPYKGKGIKYLDEVILRKAGKVVKAVGK